MTPFVQALLNPEAPLPAGLQDPQGRPAPKRFAVYRNNVAVSLTGALESGFPVIRSLLGEDFFTAMAGIFLRAHPPQSPVLMFYGAEMPAFLASFPPVQHLGYLPDIARLELALRESYHAADAAPIAPEALAAIAPETLLASQIHLAPSLRLIRSAWPIHAIWRLNTTGGPKPVMQPEDVVILRPGFDPEPQLLPKGGAQILLALQAGESLAKALEQEPDCDLNALLGLLISQAAITKVTP
jgi:hypothetical protein